MEFPNLFCPDCSRFLTLDIRACSEGCAYAGQSMPDSSGQPLWRAQVAGAVQYAVIFGNMVVFAYGSRGVRGGVAAFGLDGSGEAWSFETAHPVEAPPVVFQQRLYFASTGSMGVGAEVISLDIQGRLVWRSGLTAGAWSQPIVDHARLLLALDDGTLAGFDSQDGKPLTPVSVNLPRGKNWLVRLDDSTLLALSGRGEIMSLQSRGLQRGWLEPQKVGGQVTTAPCLHNKCLYFGLDGGRLACFDPQTKQLTILSEGFRGLLATTLIAHGKLWLGGFDGCLHVLDHDSGRELWKSETFSHRIISAVSVEDGYAAVCVNQHGVVLYSTHSYQKIWHHPVDEGARLFSAPLIHQGVVLVGSEMGVILALPCAMGDYSTTAEHYKARKDLHRAGLYYALAARTIRQKIARDSLYQKAAECWHENGEAEWAARMWEGLGEVQQAAGAYFAAGEDKRGVDNNQALQYFEKARSNYLFVAMDAEAQKCAQSITLLSRGPIIRLEEINNPRMVQGRPGAFTLRVYNHGQSAALNAVLTLKGSLSEPAKCYIDQEVHPQDYLDLTMSIVQSQAESVLQAEFVYGDARNPANRARQQSTLVVNLKADPPPNEVIVEDSTLINSFLNIFDSGGRPVKFTVRNSTLIGSTAGKPVEEMPKPAFPWPDYPAGLQAEKQTLLEVFEVEHAQFDVPNTRWAIFLADEAVIAARVPPGPYLRSHYEHLSPVHGRMPVWKAITFRRGAIRLAFRLGPFSTSESAQVGVDCGLVVELQEQEKKPFELWRGVMGEKPSLSTADLETHLSGEVQGALQTMLARKSLADLAQGFSQRDAVLLALAEELGPTLQRFGICLVEKPYYLDFIVPGREARGVFWQAGECPGCQASRLNHGKFCDDCGRNLACT